MNHLNFPYYVGAGHTGEVNPSLSSIVWILLLSMWTSWSHHKYWLAKCWLSLKCSGGANWDDTFAAISSEECNIFVSMAVSTKVELKDVGAKLWLEEMKKKKALVDLPWWVWGGRMLIFSGVSEELRNTHRHKWSDPAPNSWAHPQASSHTGSPSWNTFLTFPSVLWNRSGF